MTFEATFVHGKFPELVVKGEVSMLKDQAETSAPYPQLQIVWTPKFKGHYTLYFNGIKPYLQPDLLVLGNKPVVENSKVEVPFKTQFNFCEQICFTFFLKDQYFNNYGQMEHKVH